MLQKILTTKTLTSVIMFVIGVVSCIFFLSMRRAPYQKNDMTTLDTALQQYLKSTNYTVTSYQGHKDIYVVNGTTLLLQRQEDKSFKSLGSIYGSSYPVIITNPDYSVPLQQITESLYNSGYTGTYRISRVDSQTHEVTLRDIETNKTFTIQFLLDEGE